MKVLFLDVDGVLNSTPFLAQVDAISAMDPYCVERLNRIVRESGCKIVVSSCWRLSGIGVKSDFRRCLVAASKGDDTARRALIGTTPSLDEARGFEIAQWLSDTNEEIESFVILDDDTDMGKLSGRLIRTDVFAEHPLDDERAAEVLRLFADPEATANNSFNQNPETDAPSLVTMRTGVVKIRRVENLDNGGMIVHYTNGMSDVYEFREGPIPGQKPVKYNPPARLVGHVHKVERLLSGRTIERFD
jgi:hypothetical protein